MIATRILIRLTYKYELIRNLYYTYIYTFILRVKRREHNETYFLGLKNNWAPQDRNYILLIR